MDYPMKNIAVALMLVLSVAGCSSTTKSATTAAASTNADAKSEMIAKADGEKKLCYHEKTIGSNRKSNRCTTKSEAKRVGEVSREAWLRSQQGSVKTGN